MKKSILLSAVFAVVAFGCAPAEEEVTADTGMPKFEGTADPKFVGTWKNERSTYDFRKDGTFSHEGQVSYQGNVMQNNFEGKWALNEDRFLIQDQSGNTSAYTVEMSGDTLTLTGVGSMKNQTVLKKG